MKKTVNDLLGIIPIVEPVKPVDDCIVVQAKQELVDESRIFADIGEEAEFAVCEICNGRHGVDKYGVCCEACGGFFCRGVCWNSHWCSVMTDSNGREIRVGDKLRYVDGYNHTFTVTSMEKSFLPFRICHGRRGKEEDRILPIRPRLMKLVE